MSNKAPLLQCRNCGHIHPAISEINNDSLYCIETCASCQTRGKHLVLSSDPEDIYLLYDPVDDPRFYEYKE